MDIKQAVYWHQGLFLQPQHFQLFELNQKFQRKPLFHSITPDFWGVGDLDFSESALGARSFEVRSAKLVLRDGTYLEFPGNAHIAARSFDKLWEEGDQPLDVYLGLKKFSPTSSNVAVINDISEAATLETRYVSVANPQPMPDLYGVGPSASVPTLTALLRVFFGNELGSAQDYDLIHITQLVRDSEDIKVNKHFVPPCYSMSGSLYLKDLSKDIRDDIAGRLRQLEEYKPDSNDMQSDDLTTENVRILQALMALNRIVPGIMHLLEMDEVHPWQLYGEFRKAAGEISTFSERYDMLGRVKGSDMLGILPYNHENLSECFRNLRQLINRMLNEISVGPEFFTIMEPREDYLYALIKKELFVQRNRFYLLTQTSENPKKSVDNLNRIVRVATPDNLQVMIDHALPGVDLIELVSPPQGLPKRANTRFYRLEQSCSEWESIERAGEIAFYWPDPPEDLRVEVVVLRG